MRKLAWAIIFILIGLLIWAGLCLLDSSIAKLSSDGLAWAGGGLWMGMVGVGNWIRTTASATNTAFLFYSLVVLILALPLWAGLRKLWSKRPKIFGKVEKGISSTGGALASATGIRSTTPAGATTRPTTPKSTTPSEPMPVLPEDTVPAEESET